MADLAERTMQASDLVFVAPLYWYGLPAPAKLYLDHWSHWMRLPDLGFKSRMAGKRAWLIMAHAGSSEAEIAPARDGLRLAAAYLGIGWGGALLADANAPGDWQKGLEGQSAAAQFFAA
jgi:putative NADPH-quinone reductase